MNIFKLIPLVLVLLASSASAQTTEVVSYYKNAISQFAIAPGKDPWSIQFLPPVLLNAPLQTQIKAMASTATNVLSGALKDPLLLASAVSNLQYHILEEMRSLGQKPKLNARRARLLLMGFALQNATIEILVHQLDPGNILQKRKVGLDIRPDITTYEDLKKFDKVMWLVAMAQPIEDVEIMNTPLGAGLSSCSLMSKVTSASHTHPEVEIGAVSFLEEGSGTATVPAFFSSLLNFFDLFNKECEEMLVN